MFCSNFISSRKKKQRYVSSCPDTQVPPSAENVTPPSSSRELVAHLINGLQLSNKLPQSLTPDNFDMSLKTILQLLKILHKSKAANGAVATPAKIKVRNSSYKDKIKNSYRSKKGFKILTFQDAYQINWF